MQALLTKDQDTICALSTPPGHGGIAVIRISGSQSLDCVRKLCLNLPKKVESHKVYFTRLNECQTQNIIDEALITYFAIGRSFTGEDTVEISCHGSQFVVQKVINELIVSGCRLAEKGEFTYRAFMNNRLDLIQAESVLNLIQSQSQRSSRQALRQLQGDLSKRIENIEQELLLVGAHLEAQIDFIEQDIEPLEESLLRTCLLRIKEDIEKLINTYNKGRLLREGVHAVFIGRPNVGKSSLLNALLNEERAIVTDIPGTTRDVVSGNLMIEGVQVKLFDTAGIRNSENPIEKIGIERTFETIKKADVVFVVTDFTDLDLPDFNAAWFEEKPIYFLINKADKADNAQTLDSVKKQFLFKIESFFKTSCEVFTISATQKKGLNHIEDILERIVINDLDEESLLVVSSRQFECLKESLSFIEQAIDQLLNRESPEFAAFEVRNAVLSVHRLLGKEYDDQIMDKVFSEFCLGK